MLDPFAAEDVTEHLQSQGFSTGESVLWAAIYPLVIPMPEGFESRKDDSEHGYSIVFANRTIRYPGMEGGITVDKEFTGSHVIVQVRIAPGWDHASIQAARSKVQTIASLLNFTGRGIGGPALRTEVWEGPAKPTTPGRVQMGTASLVARYAAQYDARDIERALLRANEILVAGPARLQLALRWFHKGLLAEESVDAFMSFWLSVTALAEGWWHTQGGTGEDAFGHTMKYIREVTRPSKEDRRLLSESVKEAYSVRKRIVHESSLAVDQSEILRVRDLVVVLIRAEVTLIG